MSRARAPRAMPARRRPEPLPAIHPVPEYRAEGELKSRYEEMKRVFQVPWMGVVTMSYAHYATVYDVLWTGSRQLCASGFFVAACRDLRRFVEEAVIALAPPPIDRRLAAAGYAPREIEEIREVVEIFSHGNFPYLVLATIMRDLLEGGELSTATAAPEFVGRHAPDRRASLVLMEPHHVDAPTRAVYDDIKATLGLPFVNTDYRALARWPSYFAMAWHDLKRVAGMDSHEALARAVHERAVAAARRLPNPGGLSGAQLRAAAALDASLDEVLGVAGLFQWLLPGLVINLAYFRQQLLARSAP